MYCALSPEISVEWYTIKLTINLTGRFHVAMGLFSNRSPVTSKFGKNKAQLPVSLMFLPHFDLLCDLFLYRPTDTWNQLRHGLMLLWFKDLMNVTEKWVCSSVYPIKIVLQIVLFIIADMVSSYWLALTFQASHVVSEVDGVDFWVRRQWNQQQHFFNKAKWTNP